MLLPTIFLTLCVLSIALLLIILSKGFDFFEDKKGYKLWFGTILVFAAALIAYIGIYAKSIQTVLWIVSLVILLFVLCSDLVKVKLWGFLAFIYQLYVGIYFPFVLVFILTSKRERKE